MKVGINQMKNLIPFVLFIKFLFAGMLLADPGKDDIGKLKVSLYLGSNKMDADAGPRAREASDTIVRSLRKNPKMVFKRYFILGSDTSSVLRSYENWATPMKPSEVIMLSFEPVGKTKDETIKLALDLWQSKRKIMKSVATSLTVGKPLFIRGPQWRGGYLIIGIELQSLK